MKKVIFLFLFVPSYIFSQPCTTTNAGGCGCPDGKDTCTLLPDINISWQALRDHQSGPNEYSQSGNGADDGRLRITGCTPNIGWGPFTVRGVDANGYRWFVCGNDTESIHDPNSTSQFTCSNGDPNPKQIIFQLIYKKEGSTMTFTQRQGGTMTYHPTHGHNHVDDWVTFTLRVEDPNEPDTLKWPIIGSGAKLGFCLEDYGSCTYYNGYCRDNQMYGVGTILNNTNMPNYGLGGGGYNCSPIEQGITVGYADIYDETLDGMWIDIPPNTCNGNYWIVAEVDPRNYFLESNENNNWTAIPYTLTKQLPAGSAVAEVFTNGAPFICHGSEVTLTSTTALSYLWSTGDTTQSITVNNPGDYAVQIDAQCGTAVSDTIVVAEINSSITAYTGDTTCISGSLDLFAGGTGTVNWYDSLTGGTKLSTGDTFSTPVLITSTTYYAENFSEVQGQISYSTPHDHSGSSQFSGFHGYINFDCLSAFTLRSVKVYTNDAGVRDIEWRNKNGIVLADTSIYIPSGTSRVTLNFDITPGTDYQLGTNENVNNTNFGSITPMLMRSSGVTYPYGLTGILSLKSSPYDSPLIQYYYYFYDWEVESGKGTCASPRQAVTALIAQPPIATFTGLDTAYQISDSVVVLTGSPTGGTFSGSGITGNIFDPFLAGIGVHTIIYSYEDSLGCISEQSSTVHVKKGQITANAGADVEICEGDTITLTASGGTIYEWSTGDTIASIDVSPVATTTYDVTVSDNFGSSDIANVKVTVNALPTVEITGLDTLYQVSDNVVVITGSPVGGTFSGNGVSGNTFDPAQAGIGLHSITYSYTDASGCHGEASVTVHVKQGTIVASAGPDVEICAGENTVLTASGGTNYAWNTGATTATIQVNPTVTTIYSVTVSDNFGSSDVADVTVTVNSLPQVSYSGLSAEYTVDDAPVELIGSPQGGTFSGPGIQGNTFYPMVAGIGGPYTITYSYTDQKGCQGSDSKQVTVKTNVGVPFTNNLQSKISVYPNPANDKVTIDWSGIGSLNMEIRLFNSVGGKLLSENIVVTGNSHLKTMDISSLVNGIYFLEIVTSETSSVTRVVKK